MPAIRIHLKALLESDIHIIVFILCSVEKATKICSFNKCNECRFREMAPKTYKLESKSLGSKDYVINYSLKQIEYNTILNI